MNNGLMSATCWISPGKRDNGKHRWVSVMCPGWRRLTRCAENCLHSFVLSVFFLRLTQGSVSAQAVCQGNTFLICVIQCSGTASSYVLTAGLIRFTWTTSTWYLQTLNRRVPQPRQFPGELSQAVANEIPAHLLTPLTLIPTPPLLFT